MLGAREARLTLARERKSPLVARDSRSFALYSAQCSPIPYKCLSRLLLILEGAFCGSQSSVKHFSHVKSLEVKYVIKIPIHLITALK